MTSDEARARLQALGLAGDAVDVLHGHFADAEARGKLGHGFSRIPWLETQSFDLQARPVKQSRGDGIDRWDGAGALGYLTLSAIVDDVLAEGVSGARLVVASPCFPTGALGYWVRRLAAGGLVALLTATSPRRLPPPSGGAPLTGTNPLAIAVPSGEGEPLVADVSMGAVTHGDVIAGRARPSSSCRSGASSPTRRSRLRSASSCSCPRSPAPSIRPSFSSRVRSTIPSPPFAPWRETCGFPATQGRPVRPERGPDRTSARSARVPQRLEDDRIDPVLAAEPLLEVRDRRPVLERRLAEGCEVLVDLAPERVVDLDPIVLRRLPEEQPVEPEEALQLLHRPLVVVDPEIDDGVGERGVPGVPLDHEQCGGLLAAAVTAGGLCSGETVEEPLGECLAGGGEERVHERVDGFRGDEDVALGGVEVAGAAAGPVVAGAPVYVAPRPAASTMPSWRWSRPSSAAVRSSTTSDAPWPARSRSSPSGP